MRHQRKGRKLNRTAEHRLALMRNLATQLFDKGTIRTTVPKAKELRRFAERLITTARKDTLAARRQVLRHIHDERVVHKLFDSLAPRYAERPGGYTRILRVGDRRGDQTELALVQLVEEGDSLQPKHGKRRSPRSDDPNAPLEVKRAALNLVPAAGSEEESEEGQEEEPEGGEEEAGSADGE